MWGNDICRSNNGDLIGSTDEKIRGRRRKVREKTLEETAKRSKKWKNEFEKVNRMEMGKSMVPAEVQK